jgi:DNA-binding SARP family transcriptional activator
VRRGGCCELFGCRVPGSSLQGACLTEECLARGALAEIRAELPAGNPVHATWIKATPLGPSRDRVLFRVRAAAGAPGDPHFDAEPAVGPRLGVLTLGRTRLDTPEGPVTGGWLDQRHGQLLKYLVCERHRVLQVEEIAEELWPDARDRGPSIVRHYIHGLRQQLEPWRPKRSPSSFIVLVVPGGYALNRDLVQVDADTFERLVTAGLAASREGRPDAVETLERALTWYRGDFMAELPYAVWTLAERERLRDLALRVLRRLGHLLAERNEVDEALSYLERAAHMQPFDTDIERELVSLALERGRYSVAMRRYAALRVRMLRKFGEEPDFELRDLMPAHHHLRSGS